MSFPTDLTSPLLSSPAPDSHPSPPLPPLPPTPTVTLTPPDSSSLCLSHPLAHPLARPTPLSRREKDRKRRYIQAIPPPPPPSALLRPRDADRRLTGALGFQHRQKQKRRLSRRHTIMALRRAGWSGVVSDEFGDEFGDSGTDSGGPGGLPDPVPGFGWMEEDLEKSGAFDDKFEKVREDHFDSSRKKIELFDDEDVLSLRRVEAFVLVVLAVFLPVIVLRVVLLVGLLLPPILFTLASHFHPGSSLILSVEWWMYEGTMFIECVGWVVLLVYLATTSFIALGICSCPTTTKRSKGIALDEEEDGETVSSNNCTEAALRAPGYVVSIGLCLSCFFDATFSVVIVSSTVNESSFLQVCGDISLAFNLGWITFLIVYALVLGYCSKAPWCLNCNVCCGFRIRRFLLRNAVCEEDVCRSFVADHLQLARSERKLSSSQCFCRRCWLEADVATYLLEHGGKRYSSPHLWTRFPFKLPRDGVREWHVGYHGTTSANAIALLEGNLLIPAGRPSSVSLPTPPVPPESESEEITLSPSLRYAAAVFSQVDVFEGDRFKIVLEFLVEPGSYNVRPGSPEFLADNLGATDSQFSRDEIEWSTTSNSDIRPNALLVKRLL